MDEKNLQHINNNGTDKHNLKGIKQGQALQFQTYLSKQKFQELIAELNNRFAE